MAQVKLVFYLPLRDNDGRELRQEIADTELELVSLFDGWTFTGVVKGMWLMADKSPAYDESNSYAVVTDESQIPTVEAILRDFKARTTQEAIYFEVQYNTDVRFL
ncbi:MAG TPA: hypothetical protein VMZ71_16945 [Gemmataceae bacterium]|nr:hypothetical protein [Gemmataceae bacterium]